MSLQIGYMNVDSADGCLCLELKHWAFENGCYNKQKMLKILHWSGAIFLDPWRYKQLKESIDLLRIYESIWERECFLQRMYTTLERVNSMQLFGIWFLRLCWCIYLYLAVYLYLIILINTDLEAPIWTGRHWFILSRYLHNCVMLHHSL